MGEAVGENVRRREGRRGIMVRILPHEGIAARGDRNMPEQTYDKRDIALTQLESALRLFREGDDYFSALTLAGAAGGILGDLLRLRGRQNALDDLISGAVLMHKHLFGEEAGAKEFANRANRARNALKHLEAGGFPTITLDIRDEAKDMLTRAIDNYWLLEESLTPAMGLFTREQRTV